MARTRTFTREQLDTLGLPDDLATETTAADFPEAAVELHREQVDTRRWVSVHELVFRAPDDGKAYRVTYEQGLTEHQDDTDAWDYARTVEAVEVEQYERSVPAWRPVEEHQEQPPACGRAAATGKPCPDHAETALAFVDGRDALAYVIIRPAGETDDAEHITVDAAARGMSKAATAYALRSIADQFDAAAAAEGDEPIPYPATEQPTGQKFPCGIAVFCDQCGTTHRGDYIVTDQMTRGDRLEVARDHLRRNEGWSCTADGDFCPGCKKTARAH
ncbi:hypothetical protein ACFW4X_20965 [Streptomyces smyrnaeus]|uniref:hypothetical protein n=1 Tax=Streptomyces smyrnaeus TaxID=1387713 RepID=UPI00367C2F46